MSLPANAFGEVLRSVPGYLKYHITLDGRIVKLPWRGYRNAIKKGGWRKAFSTGRFARGGVSYLGMTLSRGGKLVTRAVHYWVLISFRGPAPFPLANEGRHMDGQCQHNHLDNLRWGTHQENMQDLVKHNAERLAVNK